MTEHVKNGNKGFTNMKLLRVVSGLPNRISVIYYVNTPDAAINVLELHS